MVTPARIKSAREDLKLTKRELAKRIGVHESSINKYEKGLVDIRYLKYQNYHVFWMLLKLTLWVGKTNKNPKDYKFQS